MLPMACLASLSEQFVLRGEKMLIWNILEYFMLFGPVCEGYYVKCFLFLVS